MSNQWAWGWRPEQVYDRPKHDLSRKAAGASVEPGVGVSVRVVVLADNADLRGERGNRNLTV